jgi:hypothetical protein
MRAHEEVDFAAWSLLRTVLVHQAGGSDLLRRQEASSVLAASRRSRGEPLDPRSVRRIIRRGAKRGYWTIEKDPRGGERLRLTGVARVMVARGVTAPGTTQLIPAEHLRTPTQIRQRLYATVHELPNHSGEFRGGLLSRLRKEELTGVPERTQRRYDNEHGASELVQEQYAFVEGRDGPPVTGQGYFPGGDRRQQWRRLADLRTPSRHWRGSKSAGMHAGREARQLRAASSRGEEAASRETCEQSPRAEIRGAAPSPLAERRVASGATESEARRRFLSQCPHCKPGDEKCPHARGIYRYPTSGGIGYVIREGPPAPEQGF